MRREILLKIQKGMSMLTLIIALVIFITALGFMTNMHVLMFDGTADMYEYYKSLQILNKSMFDISIIYVIYAFLLIPFDINKLKPGIFGTILVITGTVVTVLKSMTMFKYIPYFKGQYNSLDFTILEDYTSSLWQFDFARSLFLFWDIIAAILVIIVVMNFIQLYKEKKTEQVSRGGIYEA